MKTYAAQFKTEDGKSLADVDGPVYVVAGDSVGESNTITLRDWFAGQALSAQIQLSSAEHGWDDVATYAYQMADAMIAARVAGNEATSPRPNHAALLDAVTRLMKFVRTYRAGFVRSNTVGLDLGTMEKEDRAHLDDVDKLLAVGAAAVLAETGGAA